MGDGSDLNALDTAAGRLASLICWENYMPLARFHLYAQGPEVWLAPTLATADFWVASMRHIAREGGCFVVGVAPVMHPDWLPESIPGAAAPAPDRADEMAPPGVTTAGTVRPVLSSQAASARTATATVGSSMWRLSIASAHTRAIRSLCPVATRARRSAGPASRHIRR
jgi:nitrilase